MTAMTIDQAWRGVFTPAQAQTLSEIQGEPVVFPPRQRIARQDAARTEVLYLTSGFAGCYRADRFGRRQLVGLQIPGDYIDLPGLTLGTVDYELAAIDEVRVRGTPHARMQSLWTGAPVTVEKLWRILMIDAAIHRYWIFRLGRLAGRARVANFFCEMMLRLYSRGLCEIERFHLPINQTDLAECCGMTPVHANRMLAELREEGICTFSQNVVEVAKLPELFDVGQYSWNYLYLDPELDRELRDLLSGARVRMPPRTGVTLRTGTGRHSLG